MGQVITPKYRIEMSYVNFTNKRHEIAKMVYDVKKHGKPTVKNAKKFRDGMNQSMRRGGSNAHLMGTQSDYGTTFIVNQHTGETVVEFKAPMFEVMGD